MCSEYTGGQFIQVKLTKISYIGTLFKVWFIQDSGLSMVWFIQGLSWTDFTLLVSFMFHFDFGFKFNIYLSIAYIPISYSSFVFSCDLLF